MPISESSENHIHTTSHAQNPSMRTTELEVSSTHAYNPSTSTTELDVSSTHAYNPSTRTTELEVSSTDAYNPELDVSTQYAYGIRGL